MSEIQKTDRPSLAWSSETRRSGRGTARHAGLRGLFLRFLVALMVAIPLVGGYGVGTVAGDALSDAQAQQAALQQQIAANKAKVAALTASQSTLNGQISATKTALASVNANLQSVQAQVASLQAQVDEVQAAYNSLVAQVEDLSQKLALIEVDEHAAETRLTERKALLAAHLRAAYMTDQASILQTILSAQSFTDIVSDVTSYLTIGESDEALAKQIEQDKATLAVVHQSVEETRAATDELRQQTADEKAQLDARMADLKDAQAKLKALQDETNRQLALQQKAYASLAANKASLEKALAADQASEAALAKKIDLLLAQAGGRVPSVYNGSFIWPMRGVVTQEFGCTGFSWEPAYGSCPHYHNAIDIANTIYTPIKAAAMGQVLFVGPNPYDSYPQAWIIIIAHAQNLTTRYAHIDNGAHGPVVRVGQWVQQGELIAYEGMTGHTTGPHLDWAVRLNGTYVNPRLFL